MLLNCQLESEGRETFLCRPEMTLAECTNSMNEKMYQIYHFMNSRASAVCSALKQDQMRMLTEITINRLFESSQSQIDILHDSLSNQKLLYEKSKVNMKEHDDSHDKIMEAHMTNLDHLKITESMINDNIENLQRDLDMRKKSEAQLDEIDQTIHGISVKLVQQSAQIHATQQLFLEDVDKISEAFRRHNQVILEQHRETLSYLESLRDIIMFLSSIVESINQFRMRVIDILRECGLEMSQDVAILLTMNFAHFLAAMILLIFLELKSTLPKRMLIATFTFNSASILTRANLPLLSLNILVWFTYVTVRVLKVVKRKVFIFYAQWRIKRNQANAAKMSFKRAKTPQNFDHQRRSPTPAILIENRPKSRNEQRQPSVNNLDDDSEMEMIFQKTETVPASRPMTPAMKRVISESYIPEQNRSIPTPFQTGLKGRIQCVAKTTKGVNIKFRNFLLLCTLFSSLLFSCNICFFII